MGRRAAWFGLLLLGAAGCASSSEGEAPRAQAAEPAQGSQPAPRTRTRTRAGAKPRKPAEPAGLPSGHVLISVRRADLARDVLPMFERQAGVQISWSGEPRQLSLPLDKPVPWEDALDLVCQFTDTHLVRRSDGRLILRDRWEGRGAAEVVGSRRWGSSGGGAATAGRPAGARAASGASGGAASGSSGGAASSSSAGQSASTGAPTQWDQNYGGAERSAAGRTATGLLKNTTPTRSGR